MEAVKNKEKTIKKYTNLFEYCDELILFPNNIMKTKLRGSKYSCHRSNSRK